MTKWGSNVLPNLTNPRSPYLTNKETSFITLVLFKKYFSLAKSNISLIAGKTCFYQLHYYYKLGIKTVTFCMAKGPKQGTKNNTNIQDHQTRDFLCSKICWSIFLSFIPLYHKQLYGKITKTPFFVEMVGWIKNTFQSCISFTLCTVECTSRGALMSALNVMLLKIWSCIALASPIWLNRHDKIPFKIRVWGFTIKSN